MIRRAIQGRQPVVRGITFACVKLRHRRGCSVPALAGSLRREGDIWRRRHPDHAHRLPGRRRSRRRPATSPCSTRRTAATPAAIDVVATITNVRATCDETRRLDRHQRHRSKCRPAPRHERGARDVVLPYFATVVQGGSNVVAKRVSRVALRFADGQLPRPTTAAPAPRGAARGGDPARRHPPQIYPRAQRAGDPDAALDPMADPAVRAAVAAATLRAAGRLRAHPGPAALQRHALGCRLDSPGRFSQPRAPRVFGDIPWSSTGQASCGPEQPRPAAVQAADGTRERVSARFARRRRRRRSNRPGISQAKGPRGSDTLESVRRSLG